MIGLLVAVLAVWYMVLGCNYCHIICTTMPGLIDEYTHTLHQFHTTDLRFSPHCAHCNLDCCHYLHQGRYVIVVVCLSVCLFVICQLCAKSSDRICMKLSGKAMKND